VPFALARGRPLALWRSIVIVGLEARQPASAIARCSEAQGPQRRRADPDLRTATSLISNSGELPPARTAETLLKTHDSRPPKAGRRQHLLARGLIEACGSGYEMIRKASPQQAEDRAQGWSTASRSTSELRTRHERSLAPNLKYMRALAAAWPEPAIVQRALHKPPRA
jgi:hypothetical protein